MYNIKYPVHQRGVFSLWGAAALFFSHHFLCFSFFFFFFFSFFFLLLIFLPRLSSFSRVFFFFFSCLLFVLFLLLFLLPRFLPHIFVYFSYFSFFIRRQLIVFLASSPKAVCRARSGVVQPSSGENANQVGCRTCPAEF